jgi:hypothetical protein
MLESIHKNSLTWNLIDFCVTLEYVLTSTRHTQNRCSQ